jgi:hypothetical protein
MARAPLRRGGDTAAPAFPLAIAPTALAGPNERALRAGMDTGAATLADRVQRLLDRSQAALDQAAEQDALTAGAAAGEAAPGTLMEGGGAIYQAAYNRAAVETGARRLEIAARDRLDQLAREHAANPAAFAAAAKSYRDGMVGELPDQLRPRMAQTFDAIARPYAGQIAQQHERQVADQAIAAWQEAQPRREASVERLARAAMRDPGAQRALEAELDAATTDLIAMGPRVAFAAGSRSYEADPTRAGALSVEQVTRARQALQERADYGVLMGAYQAGPRSEAWIDEVEKRARNPAGEAVSARALREAVRDMRADQADRRRAAAEARAGASAELQPMLTANAVALAQTGRVVTRIPDELYRRAGWTPARIAQQRASETTQAAAYATRAELAAADTPEHVSALAERFAVGSPLFLADPRAASAVLDYAGQRGVQIRGASLTARIHDLQAQADAPPQTEERGGRARPAITAEEGAAAGLRPEQVTAVNADLAERARRAELRAQLLRASPDERQRITAQLESADSQTAADAAAARGAAQAIEAQRRGLAEAPADYVMQLYPALRTRAERAAQGDMPALAGLVTALRDEQTRLGVPAHVQQPLPTAITQGFVAAIQRLPTEPERVARLRAMLDAMPDRETRQAVIAAMRSADLPEPLLAGAALAPRIGDFAASRIATELATDPKDLNLARDVKASVETYVPAVFNAADRLGGLRAAQAQATGNAEYLRAAAADRDRLERIVAVRAGAAGRTSTDSVRTAYQQLFGGLTVVQQGQIMAAVPTGTDEDKLERGLTGLLTAALDQMLPGADPQQRQLRAALARGTWIDAADGRLVFYPEGVSNPLRGPQGGPLTVTVTDALAAAPRVAGRPTPEEQLRAQQRALRDRGREIAREAQQAP